MTSLKIEANLDFTNTLYLKMGMKNSNDLQEIIKMKGKNNNSCLVTDNEKDK